MYDADDSNLNTLKNHDFIGSLEFSPATVINSMNQTLKKPLTNSTKRNPGTIKISAQEKKSDYGQM